MKNAIKDRTLGVPRGLLRFLVLKMLSEKPMSGTEIIEEIENQTGSWKPSPGSIYPLLSWLQKKGFTEELPKDELGFKRYYYTEEGKQFLKKQMETAKEFITKMEFLAPMLVGGFNLDNNKRFSKTKQSAKKLVKSFILLRKNLDNLSKDEIKKLSKILEESSKKIEEIIQTKNQKNNYR
jgi:DNA-binding PadR family transcriptional regulator